MTDYELETGREAGAVRVALRALPRATAPADLWPALARRIRAERQQERRRHVLVHRLVPSFAPLAAAAALVLAVFLAGRPSVKSEPPAGPSLEVLLAEHNQLANEPAVSGDDLLAAESALKARLASAGQRP